MIKLFITVLFLFSFISNGVAIGQGKEKIAVIVIDIQGGFTELKHGSLMVPKTDESYIKAVEENTKKFKAEGYPIFATQDWHPANHISFFTNHEGKKAFDIIKFNGKLQTLWPPHSVQNTSGANILLDNKLFNAVVKKGIDPNYDSYSGFQDDGGRKTELDSLLKKYKIKTVIIYGIATDYCVRATALDAVAAGYKVILLKSLSRGVDPENSHQAINDMKAKGVIILNNFTKIDRKAI